MHPWGDTVLRNIIAILCLATSAVALSAADQVSTLSERSYARARAVLDKAVDANGGADALRAIKVVRLIGEGDTYPRLQMTTPDPPFEGGRLHETLLPDAGWWSPRPPWRSRPSGRAGSR